MSVSERAHEAFILPDLAGVGVFRCGMCNSPNVTLTQYGEEERTYAVIHCLDCGNYKVLEEAEDA